MTRAVKGSTGFDQVRLALRSLAKTKSGQDAGRRNGSKGPSTPSSRPASFAVLVLAAIALLLPAAAQAKEVHVLSTTFGAATSTPANPYPLLRPTDVAIDHSNSPSAGDLYVADTGHARVEKFSPTGEFLLMFGAGVITAGAEGTGDLTEGSTLITSVTTTSRAFLLGQAITGAGIPPATTITALGEGTITLSNPATATGTGATLTVAAGAGVVPNDERQVVTLSPEHPKNAITGGTFTLTFSTPDPDNTEAATEPIPFNAPPSGTGSVQEALEGLPNIGPGNVAVTSSNPGGGAGPGGPYTVEFKGARFADVNVRPLTGSDAGIIPPRPQEETNRLKVATTLEGHSAAEVCTEATRDECQPGTESDAPGGFDPYVEGEGGRLFIAVDESPGPEEGDLYVSSEGGQQFKTNDYVSKFEPDGALIAAWGASGQLHAPLGKRFNQIQGIAVTASGTLYVLTPPLSGNIRVRPLRRTHRGIPCPRPVRTGRHRPRLQRRHLPGPRPIPV